ncbi:MAG: zinc-binding alcohol dehydrogenase [Clostridia bacterium]|nr:zinc-binding alcohol dehydrogenase [Clostridia bacterium]
MSNRTIVFTAPYVTEILEKPIPTLNRDEVLIKIERTSISAGTERANLTGDPSVSWASEKKVKFPRSSGYSAVGVVCEVGDGVTTLQKGDRVACSWSKHAEYCKIKEKCAYRLPDGIPSSAAALVHIATFPMAAIRKCRLEIGESAIVMGLGVLGLIAVELLRAAGAVPIIAVDPIESKRRQALELGADYALDPFDPDFAKTVKEITDGGANVAIEITGKGQGLDMVLDCMKRFGRVALLGCTRNSEFTIDYYRKVHGPGITLVGAHTSARPELESSNGWWTERDDAISIIRLLKGGRIDLARLVEEVHSPLEAVEIFERLTKEPSFPVVQFDWTLLN